MNSLEAGALGNPVLAGKSSPAPEFSISKCKYSATAAQMGISHWALWAPGWAWNRHEETAGTEAILSAAGLETAKKPKRTFDTFDGCD